MTTSTNDRKIQYTATASQTVFPYDFPIYDQSYITVKKTTSAGVTSTLTITTDYSVSGVGSGSGGNITLVSGATLGDVITILGATPISRLTDFSQAGDFLASELNKQLDSFVQILQQNLRDALKSIALKDTSALSGITIEDPVANKLLVVGADGNIKMSASSFTDIETQLNTLAAISAYITTVAGIASAVSAVSGVAVNIPTVAGSAANINTVAGISANVTTVAGISANVTTVAGLAASIASVVANLTSINNAASFGFPTLVSGDEGKLLRINPARTGYLAFNPPLPTIQKIISGSGTYNKNYAFVIASGSATVGATYTNNGITYTVYATVASAVQVVMSGSGAPTTSGTLTKASGTGDSTLTFSSVLAPSYLKVKMVGGGGGGSGSGVSGGIGGTGGNTTFGSSLLTANGGVGGNVNGVRGGIGGTASLGTGPIGTAIQGGTGGACGTSNVSGTQLVGGSGAASPFGGSGGGSGSSNYGNGGAAITNSGSGGGGAGGSSTTTFGGTGGGAGGFVDAIIGTPSATYSYAVGAAGAGGTAGTSGYVGGAGGSGYIQVTEFYQ